MLATINVQVYLRRCQYECESALATDKREHRLRGVRKWGKMTLRSTKG